MDKQFKRSRKGAVSLTSLLDLLFVMIFVSLLQQKEISPTQSDPVVTKTEVKIVEKIIPEKVIPEKILSNINSTFEFYSLSGTQFRGKFSMEGLYNSETGNLNLVPAVD